MINIMTNIQFLNPENLLNNISFGLDKSVQVITDITLQFKKVYPDVQECLTSTSLILDLQNIIMTYVNDEISIPSTIVHAYDEYDIFDFYISMIVDCNIWSDEYKFDMLLVPKQNNFDTYVFYDNNIITPLTPWCNVKTVKDRNYFQIDNVLKLFKSELPIMFYNIDNIQMMRNMLAIIEQIVCTLKT